MKLKIFLFVLLVHFLISTSASTTVDTNFKTFCTANGNFINSDDPTCTTYIYCYMNRGTVRDCEIVKDKQGYFNGDECVYDKPATCT